MFSILFCIINSVIANPIKLGETYQGIHAPWQSDTRFTLYDLEIKEVIPDQDLILVVKQQSALGNPDIFVSTTVSEPNENTAEMKCQSLGMDLCIIENPKVTTYHIAIYCERYCRFTFKAVYQKELKMTNQDDLEFKLSDSWTEIVVINVNQMAEQFYSSAQTLEIQVRLRNLDILQESFKSYLNKGDDIPTPEKYDYSGSDTFSGLQKFKIQNVSLNQNFTLAVESQQGSIIEVQTRTFGIIRNIQLGEKLEDVVLEGDYQFYCLNLSNEVAVNAFSKNVLNIQLLPYKGFVELYVNFDFQPAFLTQYTWKLADRVTDDLVITQDDMKQYNFTGHSAYIAVVGKESNATYELKSQLVDPEYMILEINKPTSGKLKKDKQIQYEFYIRSDTRSTVSVSLQNSVGDADIVLKQCNSIWSCKVEENELKNRVSKVNQQPGQLFLYSDEPGNDIIVFDNLPGKCQQIENTYQCYYVVLIHPGIKNNQPELTYSILVTRKGNTIILRENTPLKQFVSNDLYNYYKFIVDEQDQIRRMMIQITPIQGQPKLYYSKSEQFPTKESFDEVGTQNAIILGRREGASPTPGTYFIGVYGYTASQYIITVLVFRNQGDWNLVGKYPNQYIQLLEGDPQEISTDSREVQLFKIDMSNYYDPERQYHQSVEVALRIIQGDYLLFGFDHPEINTTEAFLQGNNSLILPSDSKIYPQYLYIRVESNPYIENTHFSYQIYYRVASQPIELVLGNNHKGFIKNSETQTFFLNYFKNLELIITKHLENHDQSLLKADVFVGSDKIEMTETSLTLTQTQLKYDDCKTEATEIIKCQITMLVTSQIDSYFSLIVTKDESIVRLYESEPVTRPIREIPDHYTFVLFQNETEIAIFSISGEMNILVKILQHQPNLDEYPTNDQNSDLQSLNDQFEIGSSVFISKDLINKNQCYLYPCQVAITCTKAESEFDNKGEYTITYTSSVIPLYEGYSYLGSVTKQRMKYFKTSPMPLNQGLMVIATPLSSGSLILLASRDQMPTLDIHDFSSNSVVGDQLIIQPILSDEQATFYIGVYSFQDVDFSIQINIGTVHFYQINKRFPFNIILERNSTAYLNYFHVRDQGFNILITHNTITDYGRPTVSVTTYQEMHQQGNALNQTSDKYKWQNIGSYLEVKKDDSKFCQMCYYLIQINNTYFENDITVTIASDGEPIMLIDNLEQKNVISVVQQSYHYRYDSQFYINITLLSGQIEVYGGVFKMNSVKLTNMTESYAQGFYSNTTIFINSTLQEGIPSSTYEIRITTITSKSVYRIECISDKAAIELKIGETQSLVIGSAKTVPFYFVIPEQSKQQSFYSLTVETYGHSPYMRKRQEQHPRVLIQRDLNFTQYYNSPYHNFFPVPILAQNETDRIIYFEFANQPGIYFIEITPREPSTLQYWVTLGNSELNVIVPRMAKFVTSRVGQLRLWELNILEPSKVLIQAQICNGIVNVFGSDNLNALQQGEYDNKIDYRFNKQVIGFFDIKTTGPYYLGSKVTKSLKNLEKSSYILTVFLFKLNSIIPNEHFEPGDGGDVSATFDGNNITVSFVPIRITEKSSKDYHISSIIYFLVYEKLSLFDNSPLTQCSWGIQYETLQVKQTVQSPDTKLELSQFIDQDFEQVLFSIHARVFVTSNNLEEFTLDYFYNTNSIKQDNLHLYQLHKGGYRRVILMVILTVLLMAIVFLYIRNRRLQKMVKYESSDQNNQTLVRQEQQIEMNYANMH